MRKKSTQLAVLGLLMTFATTGVPVCMAGETVNTTTTITWPFSTGAADQLATFSEGTAGHFKSNYVTLGSNLSYVGNNVTFGVTFTRVQPAAQLGAASSEGMVGFCVRPKTGLGFTPTAISFDCLRYGTDGGNIDVVWKSGDGTLTTLATAVKPKRNNDASATPTHESYNLTTNGLTASTGEGVLQIFVYNLGNTKQIGIANVTIQGTIAGTVIDVVTDTVALSVSPAGAGTATVFPVGTSFDRGTPVVLKANRNFGYEFAYWALANGDSVSAENPDSITLNGNIAWTAVFRKLPTYTLTLGVDGGAKDYMVSASPAGTMVEGKRMYEGGTTVTITAKSNPVLTFTNWGGGETSAELPVIMNQDRTVNASYSAIDFLAGWDFWRTGNSGRFADFASSLDNETATLILRDNTGTTKSWLDKSQLAAGGYEGAPAAVNWSPLTDKNYYQVLVNAKDFTDLKVRAAMLFNYNAYSVQRCEYSLNDTTYNLLGTYTMASAKVWYDSTYSLPSAANHAAKVYIRWIPDYNSPVLGTTSNNDGTCISGIYVTGKASIFNDGVAPVLVSSVPANNATGASSNGKIVLTFDEKIQISEGTTVKLGSKDLTPVVTGKTITFPYTALDYNTQYTFNLASGTVSDLSGNTLNQAISIQFTTMVRPTVSKKKFDFVVGVDGDFKAALAAANTASSSGKRFHIFFPNGQYNIGALTGDGNQMTTISIPNVSYVGQNSDSVVVYNKSINESINSTATIHFAGASANTYMQDISLMNKMDYRTGVLLGRGVALWDQGSKSIYKNVKLLSNQDTYYTGADRTYLENCDIHGTVDFICGGGDLFFNECLIYLEERGGNCITAPATNSNWGYVFNNCTIDGFEINNNSYRLGRPWSNAPKTVFINTIMKQLPAAGGWGDPMNVVPAVFAEYNSMTANGGVIDLSTRRSSYTKDATTVNLNPALTTAQAANYTLQNVLGGTDAWQPNLYTEQASAPVVTENNRVLSWADSDYVLCWGVFKNGKLVEFVTTNSYTIPADVPNNTSYTVRAANEMGGLSAKSNVLTLGANAIQQTETSKQIVEVQYYSIDGRRLSAPARGLNLVRTRYNDGSTIVTKILQSKRVDLR